MEKRDFVFHFLFLLFRAFHSPSWVAKLPKSSFTFLFLSESLKHGARKKKKLEAFFLTEAFRRNILVWRSFLSRPVHDLVELLSGQEARVLPDLPQSALELLLILVLQSLLLSLLSGAATLLPIVQPENYLKNVYNEIFKTDAQVAHLHALTQLLSWKTNFYLHFNDLRREQLQRNRLLLLQNQPTVSHRSTADGLQDLPVKLLRQNNKRNRNWE